MKRALELVEPLPPTVEDCFAEFDKVFDSLATELEWQNAAPAPAPAPTAQIALVEPQLVPAPAAPAAPAAPDAPVDVLQQYERAFSVLDDRLAKSDARSDAKSDGVEVTALAERPARRSVQPRAVVTQMVPARAAIANAMTAKRPRRANRTFDDVFGVLENISIVRRRGRLSEECYVIARLLSDARQLCADLELQSARGRVEFAVLTLENNHFDKLASEIDELARHIRHDLRFCSIAPGKKAASR